MSFLGEIKRRKVFQVAAVYAVVAWLIIQVIGAISEPLNLPEWLDTVVIILLAVGFPIAIILAWAFDLGPQGIRPAAAFEREAPLTSGSTGNRFNQVTQVLVLLAVGFLVVDQFVLDDRERVQADGADSDVRSLLVSRFAYNLPSGQTFGSGSRSNITISPDGSYFLYSAGGLYLRALDDFEPRQILGAQGTEDSLGALSSSPDGEAVAFWDGQREQLQRIAITGGAPVVIAEGLKSVYGVSWADEGTIFFAERDGIFRVSSTGDALPELVIPTASGRQAYGPQLLPNSDYLLFSVATPGDWDSGEIVVQSITTGDRRLLVSGGTSARYLPTGHIIYALGDRLFVRAFDLDSLSAVGRAVPVAEGVMRGSAVWQTGVAHFSVSENGTLIYVTANQSPPSTLFWVDRDGSETLIPIEPGNYEHPRISPDGTRVALSELEPNNDIWIWDFQSGTNTRLLLGANGGDWPVWTPDGTRIAYHPGFGEIIDWKDADNRGEPERVLTGRDGRDPFHPEVFSPSGMELLFWGSASADTGIDIGMVTIASDSEPNWLLQGPYNQFNSDISPDSRWIAYQSDESGRSEIYVRSFPKVDEKRWLVSNRGGSQPLWSRDGRELFYLEPGAPPRMIAVGLQHAETDFAFVARNLVMDWPYKSTNLGRDGRSYDASADGRRFLVLKPMDGEEESPRIVVIQNWFEELKRLEATI